MLEKGKAEGIDTRGISDHGFIHSIYFRDPNGYVVELAAQVNEGHANREDAHHRLSVWQAGKN